MIMSELFYTEVYDLLDTAEKSVGFFTVLKLPYLCVFELVATQENSKPFGLMAVLSSKIVEEGLTLELWLAVIHFFFLFVNLLFYFSADDDDDDDEIIANSNSSGKSRFEEGPLRKGLTLKFCLTTQN